LTEEILQKTIAGANRGELS